MTPYLSISLSFLGGMVPAFIWLLFWLREDAKHPEPKKLIALAFIAGMAAVPVTLPLERAVIKYVLDGQSVESVLGSSAFVAISAILLWAAIEECLKFIVSYIAVLRKKEVDEPTDPAIYLITAALGFAAVENTLFILNPILAGNALIGLVTGNMRFLGASLLHVISAAVIGLSMGLAFYKSRRWRKLYTVFGILSAIMLHIIFNFFILISASGSRGPVIAFTFVWVTVVMVLLCFEKIRRVHPV